MIFSTQPLEPTPPEPPPCPQLSPRNLERQAIDLLDQGQSNEARTLLDCALRENPNSWRAKSLVRQLDSDPVEYLGGRYYWYTVQASETLSKIAQERLDSGLEFVILARYNDIAVPANLVAGQRIKIPGDEPDESELIPAQTVQPESDLDPVSEEPQPAIVESPTASSAEALRADAVVLEENGNLKGAYAKIQQAQADDPSLEGIDDDVVRVRKALVASLEEKAYSDELAGRTDDAIQTWQELLEIDPGNIPAQLSIRRLSP